MFGLEGQYWRGRCWCKGKWFIQVLATWKMRDSLLEAHLSISCVLPSLYRKTVRIGKLRNFW